MTARAPAAPGHLQQAWDEREGITVDVLDIGEEREASNRIKQGLHIDLSQQRARALESATGTSLQYNPRRRQDIDIVYLPVSAQQARSIKPLLAFHFAQDLPVYANSRSLPWQARPARGYRPQWRLFHRHPLEPWKLERPADY